MARKHARLCTLDRTDPEWHALPRDAQWLYTVLLRQPRLTLAGTLDLVPARWCGTATDTTADQCDQWLDVLAAHRFVIIDRATSEVLIRTFARHDLDPGRLSAQVVKGLWSAWDGVMSPLLRAVIVQTLPDEVWKKAESLAPDEAGEIRRSAPIEWVPMVPTESEAPSPVDCPVYGLLPPALLSPVATSGSISGDLPVPAAPVAVEPPKSIDQQTNAAVAIAARLIAERDATSNPTGLAVTVGATIAKDGRRNTLRDYVTAGLSPEEAAKRLTDPLGGLGGRTVDPAEVEAARLRSEERRQATLDAAAAQQAAPLGDAATGLAQARAARKQVAS